MVHRRVGAEPLTGSLMHQDEVWGRDEPVGSVHCDSISRKTAHESLAPAVVEDHSRILSSATQQKWFSEEQKQHVC